MKKILFSFLCIFCFISLTNAKSCAIVSGTGENIGDEIKCGTESFYVIDSDGEDIKMLAKYNLYAGAIFDRTDDLKTTNKITVSDNDDNYNVQKEAIYSEIGDTCGEWKEYSDYRIISEDNQDGSYSYYCYTIDPIEESVIKQDERAIGAHGTEPGHPDFPEIGVVTNITKTDGIIFDTLPKDLAYTDFNLYDCRWDFDLGYHDCSNEHEYIQAYKETLASQEIEVKNADIITMNELNNIVKKINKTGLPLDEWKNTTWEELNQIYPTHWELYKVGSLKDLVDSKYSWLWSTTYWTRTGYLDDEPYTKDGKIYTSEAFIYFVDTLGNVCSTFTCNLLVGAGIRPVITISKENLQYSITTKTDGNGQILAERESASGGEIIKFTVKPKTGYVLAAIKVADENGNIVVFTDYTFTMPSANVVIEATFTKVNPNTKTGAIIEAFAILLISSSLAIIASKRKKKLD